VSGVVVGTRFIASPEAAAAIEYRQVIISGRDDATLRTRCYTGKPCRVIRNAYASESDKDPSKIKSFPSRCWSLSRMGS